MIKAIKKIFKWLLIGLLIFGVVWAICTFVYTFRVSYHKAKEASATEAGEVAFTATSNPEQEVFFVLKTCPHTMERLPFRSTEISRRWICPAPADCFRGGRSWI